MLSFQMSPPPLEGGPPGLGITPARNCTIGKYAPETSWGSEVKRGVGGAQPFPLRPSQEDWQGWATLPGALSWIWSQAHSEKMSALFGDCAV